MRQAIAGSTNSELTNAIATAQDQLAVLAAKSNDGRDRRGACQSRRQPTAASTDAAAAQQAKDRLGQLMEDAKAANHDFEQALAKFQEARNTILRKTAKG